MNYPLPVNPQDQSGSEDSKKGPSWTQYAITHILLSQQGQSDREDNEKDIAGPSMTSLTYFQAHETNVAVRTVRRDIAAPDMESLTAC